MLAYAAHRRRVAQRHSAPHVMLAIIAGHVALIAAVMSAKMDLPERIFHPPTDAGDAWRIRMSHPSRVNDH